MMKIKCIATPMFVDSEEPVPHFTINKEYNVDVVHNDKTWFEWVINNDEGSRVWIYDSSNPDNLWYTNYFIVVDDLEEAYDRAMGVV